MTDREKARDLANQSAALARAARDNARLREALRQIADCVTDPVLHTHPWQIARAALGNTGRDEAEQIAGALGDTNVRLELEVARLKADAANAWDFERKMLKRAMATEDRALAAETELVEWKATVNVLNRRRRLLLGERTTLEAERDKLREALAEIVQEFDLRLPRHLHDPVVCIARAALGKDTP